MAQSSKQTEIKGTFVIIVSEPERYVHHWFSCLCTHTVLEIDNSEIVSQCPFINSHVTLCTPMCSPKSPHHEHQPGFYVCLDGGVGAAVGRRDPGQPCRGKRTRWHQVHRSQVLWNNCNVQTHWMSQTDPCLSVSVTITDDHAHTELFLKWDTLRKMMWCAWKMEVLLLFPTSFMFCTWQTCMLLCHVHKTRLVTYRNSLMYWIITEIVRCIHW